MVRLSAPCMHACGTAVAALAYDGCCRGVVGDATKFIGLGKSKEKELMQPGDEVLATFGVRLVAPLGGRLNQHWLVERRGEQLVLRRWSQTNRDDIDYELRLLAAIAAMGWPVAPAVEGPVELTGRCGACFRFFWGSTVCRGPDCRTARLRTAAGRVSPRPGAVR